MDKMIYLVDKMIPHSPTTASVYGFTTASRPKGIVRHRPNHPYGQACRNNHQPERLRKDYSPLERGF